ncbi:ubiquinol-cytochrome c reductase complex assembly factor 2 isoform X2 [Eleutherodactylus coqui]|uniref:ubiquinol-cytochrome c reductase complex assembly factor 2 isoform X2 n=1 Tax=Eleutherodactylus coqui TaxID=57060 RepID=UPI00346200D4
MAALRYRRFLKLCEEWPIDESRRGRDLGAMLRQRVAQAFKEGENTQYPRHQDTSFTEITADEYRMVLATETLKQMDEMKKGMWKRLKDKFNVKSPQDEVKE